MIRRSNANIFPIDINLFSLWWQVQYACLQPFMLLDHNSYALPEENLINHLKIISLIMSIRSCITKVEEKSALLRAIDPRFNTVLSCALLYRVTTLENQTVIGAKLIVKFSQFDTCKQMPNGDNFINSLAPNTIWRSTDNIYQRNLHQNWLSLIWVERL